MRLARAHFLAHGFRGVTMDDLAAAAGMSKRTFYRHFPGKLELLDAVLEAKWGELDRDMAACRAEGEFSGRVRALLEVMHRHAGEVQAVFLRDLSREAPDRLERVMRMRRDLIRRHMGGLLRAGRRAGLVRRDMPVPLMTEILTGSMDAVVPSRLDALRLNLSSAITAIVTLFLEGVAPREGRARR